MLRSADSAKREGFCIEVEESAEHPASVFEDNRDVGLRSPEVPPHPLEEIFGGRDTVGAVDDTIKRTTIYLSGSCENRAGSYCALIVAGNETYEPIVGSETNTTSNRMILRAAIAALQPFKAQPRTALRLYSNSEYLIKNMNERIDEWKERGWKTTAGIPPDNIDLWKILNALALRHDVEWVWIANGDGDRLHRLAAEYAREERRKNNAN